ncbi:efflux RND transporter periplasmic adaptor subunit [Wukongibacter baidiensis]|uniref:efflux RND transporter periplasmic adaptor subunit n=1 Tax=Wukongibacter baidiensis TaxID=1723361 RepID=UPI003D7F49DA
MENKSMKNTKIVAILILVLAVATIGTLYYSRVNKTEAENIVKARPVKAMKIKEEIYPITLDYIGTIDIEEIKNISFKVPGKIKKIDVSEGDFVSKGMAIASLDVTDLSFNLDSAKAQMNVAKANLNRAKEDSQFTLDNYNKISKLHKDGAVSQQQFDEAELKLKVSRASLEAVTAQYEQAKANYESMKNTISDATIVAHEAGYVVDVISKEGENINSGMPVILLRPEKQIINVGLSQEDVKKVSIGQSAKVKLDDFNGEGKISNIDYIPDKQSRTYETEIEMIKEFSPEEFLIGSIAKVSININDKKGIWIPIRVLMSDGEDYVYIVEGDRIIRRNILLHQIHENKVLIDGLVEGELLVTEGMKYVKDGYLVYIEE